MKSLRNFATFALFAGLGTAVQGQTVSAPQPWMTVALDQGAHPEGCGTSNYHFPQPRADLLTGLGTGRNLERVAQAIFRQQNPPTPIPADAAPDKRDVRTTVLLVAGDRSGLGSLIGQAGDVLTSWHLVKGCADVAVVLATGGQGAKAGDGNVLRAHVAKRDEIADLALLRFASTPRGDPGASEPGAKLPLDATSPGTLDAGLPDEASAEVRAFLARSGDRLQPSSAVSSSTSSAMRCEPKEVYQGRNADNTGLVSAFDARCSGHVDMEVIVPDDKARPILLRADRNFDGKPDILVLDFSREGSWSLSFWDSDFQGTWGLVGHHPDGSMVPTTYESAEAYRASLAAR